MRTLFIDRCMCFFFLFFLILINDKKINILCNQNERKEEMRRVIEVSLKTFF